MSFNNVRGEGELGRSTLFNDVGEGELGMVVVATPGRDFAPMARPPAVPAMELSARGISVPGASGTSASQITTVVDITSAGSGVLGSGMAVFTIEIPAGFGGFGSGMTRSC